MFLVGTALPTFSRRHIYPVFAVGRDKIVRYDFEQLQLARRVEHKDVRHEIQRLKDDVRSLIAVGRFELNRTFPEGVSDCRLSDTAGLLM